jgi:hypothetical protein
MLMLGTLIPQQKAPADLCCEHGGDGDGDGDGDGGGKSLSFRATTLSRRDESTEMIKGLCPAMARASGE